MNSTRGRLGNELSAEFAEQVTAAARDIADGIIQSARRSGDDPISWVTGNRFVPPLRSFSVAEKIWQSDDDNEFGTGWELLEALVERYVSDAEVALESPEYDNALYAVDLRRFSYQEDAVGETLQDDWIPREQAWS